MTEAYGDTTNGTSLPSSTHGHEPAATVAGPISEHVLDTQQDYKNNDPWGKRENNYNDKRLPTSTSHDQRAANSGSSSWASSWDKNYSDSTGRQSGDWYNYRNTQHSNYRDDRGNPEGGSAGNWRGDGEWDGKAPSHDLHKSDFSSYSSSTTIWQKQNRNYSTRYYKAENYDDAASTAAKAPEDWRAKYNSYDHASTTSNYRSFGGGRGNDVPYDRKNNYYRNIREDEDSKNYSTTGEDNATYYTTRSWNQQNAASFTKNPVTSSTVVDKEGNTWVKDEAGSWTEYKKSGFRFNPQEVTSFGKLATLEELETDRIQIQFLLSTKIETDSSTVSAAAAPIVLEHVSSSSGKDRNDSGPPAAENGVNSVFVFDSFRDDLTENLIPGYVLDNLDWYKWTRPMKIQKYFLAPAVQHLFAKTPSSTCCSDISILRAAPGTTDEGATRIMGASSTVTNDALTFNAPIDIIGVARTGSGKTLAFLVATIIQLEAAEAQGLELRALVLAPVRELADQIHKEFEKLTFCRKICSVCCYGGQGRKYQEPYLCAARLVVGTPGRLRDFVEDGKLDLSRNFGILVLDEADRMLDEGFGGVVEELARAMKMQPGRAEGPLPPRKRITYFFTATWDATVQKVAFELAENERKLILEVEQDLHGSTRINAASNTTGAGSSALEGHEGHDTSFSGSCTLTVRPEIDQKVIVVDPSLDYAAAQTLKKKLLYDFLSELLDCRDLKVSNSTNSGALLENDGRCDEGGASNFYTTLTTEDQQGRKNEEEQEQALYNIPIATTDSNSSTTAYEKNANRSFPEGVKVLIFVAEKVTADNLCSDLWNVGFNEAAALHGGKRQDKRTGTIESFRRGWIRLLVATDVIGRGLDIPDISHVFIYDFSSLEDYVHRVGRTARGREVVTKASSIAIFEYWPNYPDYAAHLIQVLEKAGQPVPDELREIARRVQDREEVGVPLVKY
ncbi:unnamed protein product [Amoebophrya sp. A120]|nr:unnamed protein product [Amoebophrya sp. A120]|eukprot:GSA120T00000291001.1